MTGARGLLQCGSRVTSQGSAASTWLSRTARRPPTSAPPRAQAIGSLSFPLKHFVLRKFRYLNVGHGPWLARRRRRPRLSKSGLMSAPGSAACGNRNRFVIGRSRVQISASAPFLSLAISGAYRRSASEERRGILTLFLTVILTLVSDRFPRQGRGREERRDYRLQDRREVEGVVCPRRIEETQCRNAARAQKRLEQQRRRPKFEPQE